MARTPRRTAPPRSSTRRTTRTRPATSRLVVRITNLLRARLEREVEEMGLSTLSHVVELAIADFLDQRRLRRGEVYVPIPEELRVQGLRHPSERPARRVSAPRAARAQRGPTSAPAGLELDPREPVELEHLGARRGPPARPGARPGPERLAQAPGQGAASDPQHGVEEPQRRQDTDHDAPPVWEPWRRSH